MSPAREKIRLEPANLNADFRDCALAQAARRNPNDLETTYRGARNDLAYCMK